MILSRVTHLIVYYRIQASTLIQFGSYSVLNSVPAKFMLTWDFPLGPLFEIGSWKM